jgi:hypothetical protein
MEIDEFAKTAMAYLIHKALPPLPMTKLEHLNALRAICRWRIARVLHHPEDNIVFLPCIPGDQLLNEVEENGLYLKLIWCRYETESYCYKVKKKEKH